SGLSGRDTDASHGRGWSEPTQRLVGGRFRSAAAVPARSEHTSASADACEMSVRSNLYRAARILGDVEAVSSGNPKRIERRAKNKLIGRALGRSGFWRFLWR